eukprot:179089_1
MLHAVNLLENDTDVEMAEHSDSCETVRETSPLSGLRGSETTFPSELCSFPLDRDPLARMARTSLMGNNSRSGSPSPATNISISFPVPICIPEPSPPVTFPDLSPAAFPPLVDVATAALFLEGVSPICAPPVGLRARSRSACSVTDELPFSFTTDLHQIPLTPAIPRRARANTHGPKARRPGRPRRSSRTQPATVRRVEAREILKLIENANTLAPDLWVSGALSGETPLRKLGGSGNVFVKDKAEFAVILAETRSMHARHDFSEVRPDFGDPAEAVPLVQCYIQNVRSGKPFKVREACFWNRLLVSITPTRRLLAWHFSLCGFRNSTKFFNLRNHGQTYAVHVQVGARVGVQQFTVEARSRNCVQSPTCGAGEQNSQVKHECHGRGIKSEKTKSRSTQPPMIRARSQPSHPNQVFFPISAQSNTAPSTPVTQIASTGDEMSTVTEEMDTVTQHMTTFTQDMTTFTDGLANSTERELRDQISHLRGELEKVTASESKLKSQLNSLRRRSSS